MEFSQDEQCIPEYFEFTYIGTNRASSTHPNEIRSAAVFPPSFWNVHGRHMFGIPTTTNAVERFHRSQQEMLHNASHPSIPVFIENVHRQIAMVDLRVAAVASGERHRQPDRAVVLKMERFSSILASLNESNVMLVLSQLANVRLHTGDTVTTAFRVGASSGSQGPIPSDTEDTISNVQMDDVSANIEVPPTSPVPSVTSPSLDQVVVPLVLQAQLDQPIATEPPAHQERLPLQPWVEPFMSKIRLRGWSMWAIFRDVMVPTMSRHCNRPC